MGELSLKDKTAKGLFWGGISNILQQFLNLFFGIFLANLLTEGDYGMIGMLTVFAMIANNIQESGFTNALANKKDISSRDYNSVFWFSICMSFFLYTLLFFLAPVIARFYNTPSLTPLARYLFLSFVFTSFGIAQYSYVFRNFLVKEKAITNIVALVASGTTGIIMAWNGMAYWGLATQTLVYNLTNTLGYWYFSKWRPSFSFDFEPIRKMFGFSSKLMITNIFYHINNNVLNIFLGKFYNKNDVGFFTQANKWNIMAYTVVTGMISGVAQPMLASMNDEQERQRRAFRKMLRFTAFVSFPMLFGLSIVAPEFIGIALPERWQPSAQMMRVICIAGAFVPLNTLYSNLLTSKGKSGIVMWNSIGMSLTYTVSMLLLKDFGIYAMICSYVVIQILWQFLWQYFGWKQIGLSIFSALSDIFPFMGIAGITMFVTTLITTPISNIYILFFGKIVIAATIYLGTMWVCDAKIMKECIGYLRKK